MGPHRRSSHDSGGDSVNTGNNITTDLDFEGSKFGNENGPWPCGIPKGHSCLYANGGNSEHIAITKEDLVASEAVKIVCSNAQCPGSPFLHLACFTSFEETVLVCLKSQGRARGWSDKQRIQNLWTKRGYDLVYKACECSCGHGFVKKDLDWNPPSEPRGDGAGALNNNGAEEVNGAKRKRKKSKSQSKGSTIIIGLPTFGSYPTGGQAHQEHQQHQQTSTTSPNSSGNNNISSAAAMVYSTPSTSSVATAGVLNQNSKMDTTTACNIVQPTISGTALSYHHHQGEIKIMDPLGVNRNRTHRDSLSSNGSSGSSYASASSPPSAEFSSGASPGSNDGIQQPPRRALLQDRSRHDSGGSIFQRRTDYSSFNILPRHKINSYHIKMEDECSIGNDETRIFILSSYASNKMNRVPCVLCKNTLHIFDRYPLLDGTFFLSPKQHTKSCIQVKLEGKTSFLTAVCMACLEGWTGGGIVCRFCLKAWTGGHLILGTMYSYDIFAALPCCAERFKCNACNHLVCHPDQRFNFFSDYSQMVSCPNCGTQDAHFAKALAIYMTKEEANTQIQMAQNFQQQLNMQQNIQNPNTFAGLTSAANINLQGQACGGAVGGSGIMGTGNLASATLGGLRVHRVNSA